MSVSWAAVTGSGISYEVQTREWTSGGTNAYAAPAAGTCASAVTATSCAVTGLTAGTAYDVVVRATKATHFPSDWSAAVTRTAGTPGVPTGVVASASKGGVSVTWTAPTVTGDTPILKAQVRTRVADTDPVQSGDQPGAWTAAVDPVVDADASPARIIGLTVGTEVDAELRVVNTHASSDWVSAGSATPLATTTPGNPRRVSVTSVPGALVLSWDRPADDGGLPLSWDIRAKSNPPSFLLDWRALSPSPAVVSSATHDQARRISHVQILGYSAVACGRQYQFDVRAANSAGNSDFRGTGTHTHQCVPSTPTLSAAAGSGEVTLTASVSSDNHSAVLKWQYQQRSQTDGTWGSWSDWHDLAVTGRSLAQAITGLTQGTLYEFKVRAVNGVGASAASAAASARPMGAKLSMASPALSTGDGQLTVSWPAVSGAAAYEVQSRVTTSGNTNTFATPGAGTCASAVTGTSCTITGLTNMTSYDVQVRATSSTRTSGDWSATVTGIPGEPGVPTGVAASASKGGVSVTWTAPADTGGSAVTGAQVSTSTDGTTWTAAQDPVVDGGTSPARIVGLTPGTEVHVRLRVVTAIGQSDWVQATGTVTPAAITAPGQVRNCVYANTTFTNSENKKQMRVWLRCDHPADDGGVELAFDFRIDVSSDGQTWVSPWLNMATSAAAGTEAQKTHNNTTYDYVWYTDDYSSNTFDCGYGSAWVRLRVTTKQNVSQNPLTGTQLVLDAHHVPTASC